MGLGVVQAKVQVQVQAMVPVAGVQMALGVVQMKVMVPVVGVQMGLGVVQAKAMVPVAVIDSVATHTISSDMHSDLNACPNHHFGG